MKLHVRRGDSAKKKYVNVVRERLTRGRKTGRI